MSRILFTVLFLALGTQSRGGDLQFATVASGTTSSLRAVASAGGSNFVIVGANSAALNGTVGPGGLFFTGGVFPTANLGLRALTYGSGMFVAGGTSNLVFSSADGGSWSSRSKAFSTTPDLAGLAFSAASNGTFVAVAQDFAIAWADPGLATWNRATNPPPSISEQYYAVAPLGTAGFVACGLKGVIRLSQDSGRSWSVKRGFSSGTDLLGIVAGGSELVSVGTNGTIIVSSDGGANWTAAPSGTTASLNAVAYTGDKFIAVGSGGVIFTSTNATAWTPLARRTPGDVFGVGFA